MKKFILIFNFISVLLVARGQSSLNDNLAKQLDTIQTNDQVYREQLDTIRKKYATDSMQLKIELAKQWKIISEKDSGNLIQVTSIIDKYGWLSPQIVGDEGSRTLFLVIQHADLNIQKKYLPILKNAVREGNANGKYLAYLEDRIADRENRKQMYGTQIWYDAINDSCIVLPVENPDDLDKRRLDIGLSTMENYFFENFQKHWNLEQYKKDLPKIELLQKRLNSEEGSK